MVIRTEVQVVRLRIRVLQAREGSLGVRHEEGGTIPKGIREEKSAMC